MSYAIDRINRLLNHYRVKQPHYGLMPLFFASPCGAGAHNILDILDVEAELDTVGPEPWNRPYVGERLRRHEAAAFPEEHLSFLPWGKFETPNYYFWLGAEG